jgi:hypothetical protein
VVPVVSTLIMMTIHTSAIRISVSKSNLNVEHLLTYVGRQPE